MTYQAVGKNQAHRKLSWSSGCKTQGREESTAALSPDRVELVGGLPSLQRRQPDQE